MFDDVLASSKVLMGVGAGSVGTYRMVTRTESRPIIAGVPPPPHWLARAFQRRRERPADRCTVSIAGQLCRHRKRSANGSLTTEVTASCFRSLWLHDRVRYRRRVRHYGIARHQNSLAGVSQRRSTSLVLSGRMAECRSITLNARHDVLLLFDFIYFLQFYVYTHYMLFIFLSTTLNASLSCRFNDGVSMHLAQGGVLKRLL